MTFLELIQTCKDDFGKSDGEWVARYKRLLNRGQREIANANDWGMLVDFDNTFNTVAGTEGYTLTETNIKKLVNLRISTDGYEQRLEPVNYDVFTAMYPHVDTATERSTPNLYTQNGRSSTYQVQIKLYPVPDATYGIIYDFYKEPTDMSDDADVPFFPAMYHDLLIEYAMWKSYQQVRDGQMAQVFQAQFQNGLRKMIGDYRSNGSVEAQMIDYEGE